MKKLTHILLSVMMLSSALLATGCQQGLSEDELPDYSAYNHQFEFYGYHSAHDGYHYTDLVPTYVGESFLTTEQYQMYKDAGMTIFYPQSIFKIPDEADAASKGTTREDEWNKAKPEIDKLVSIGMDRTILYDEGLSWLGLNEPDRNATPDLTDGQREAEGLIGEADDQFDTIEELDAEVERHLALYADYPGVGGICLADEPKNVWYKSYGDLYNSIKRVSEKNGWDLYISFNLNPLNRNEYVYQEFYPYVEGTLQENPNGTSNLPFEDAMTRYKQYIENFMSSMQPDYIRYDDYPLRNGYLSPTYIPCMQYIAGVARDRNIEFRMVTQSFGMYSNGSLSTRKLTEEGARWLNNMIVGFGATEISYFTYYTRTENMTDGESFIDEESFVTLYGKPTNIYHFMKEIMSENQAFAPTVLQFKYQKSGVFVKSPTLHPTPYLDYVEDVNATTYAKLEKVNVNKECAMVNELYDAENNRYMYMAMNIVDPAYKGSGVYQTITLEFASEYKYALVYRDGVRKLHKLNDGKLQVKAAPGEASFVIPF